MASGVSLAHTALARSSPLELLSAAESKLQELQSTLEVVQHSPQMREQIQLLQESIEDIDEQIALEGTVKGAASSSSSNPNVDALLEERSSNTAHVQALQQALQGHDPSSSRSAEILQQQIALQQRKVQRYRRLVQVASSGPTAAASSGNASSLPQTTAAPAQQHQASHSGQSSAAPTSAPPVTPLLTGKPPALSPRRRLGGVPSSSSSSSGNSSSSGSGSSTSDSDATDLEGPDGTPLSCRNGGGCRPTTNHHSHTHHTTAVPQLPHAQHGHGRAQDPPLHRAAGQSSARGDSAVPSVPPPPLDPPVPAYWHQQHPPQHHQLHRHQQFQQHQQQQQAFPSSVEGPGAAGGSLPQLWTGGVHAGGQLARPVGGAHTPTSPHAHAGGVKRTRQVQLADSEDNFGGSYRFWLDPASSMRHTVGGTSSVAELPVEDEPRIMRALGGIPQRPGRGRRGSGGGSSASDGGGRSRRRSGSAGRGAMTPAFAVAVTKGGGLAVMAAATPGGSTDMSHGDLALVAAAPQALHMPRRMIEPGGEQRSGGNPCLTSDMCVLPPWHRGSFGATAQLTAAIPFTYSARPIGGNGGAWMAANPGAPVSAAHNPTQVMLLRAGLGGDGASRSGGASSAPEWFAREGNDSTAVIEARIPLMRNVGGAGSAGWGGMAQGFGLASFHHRLAPITCATMAGGSSTAPDKVLLVTGDSDKRIVLWHNVESLWGRGGGYVQGGSGDDHPHSRRSRRRFSSPQRQVAGHGGSNSPGVVSTWVNDPMTTPKSSLHTASVTCLGSLSGGARVASGGMDGRVMLWDLEAACSPWSVNLARGKDATALRAYVPGGSSLGAVPATWPVLETPIQTGAELAAREKSASAEAHNTVRVTSIVGHPRHRDWMLATVLPRVTTRYFLLDARTGSAVMALHAPRMGVETHSELVTPQWLCDPQLWGGEPRASCLDHHFVVGATDGYMHLFDLRAGHSAVFSPTVQSYGPVYSPCVARGNASKRVISTPVLAVRQGGGRSSDFTAWVATAGNNRRVGLHAVSYVNGGQQGGARGPHRRGAGGGSVSHGGRSRSHTPSRSAPGHR